MSQNQNNKIKIVVEIGDALEFKADVLALKYAQNLHGADLQVVKRLSENISNLDELLPMVSEVQLINSEGKIATNQVLFIGVTHLRNFGYAEIETFSYQVLDWLAKKAPETEHLCLTIHGVGYGLDEKNAFVAEITGLNNAILDGNYPASLKLITIIEKNVGRAKRLQMILPQLLAYGAMYTSAIMQQLRLRNFKCFEDQTIAFAPLTMLAGLNGQGKSSVLQALLLLRQSYQQGVLPVTVEDTIYNGPRLVLNGDLVQLGISQDVYFEGGVEENINLEIKWTDGTIHEWGGRYQPENDVLSLNVYTSIGSLDFALFNNNCQYVQAERLGPRKVFEMSSYQVYEKRQLGTRGEYTAHFLSVYGNEKIANEIMAHSNAVSPDLKDQVEAWLSEISPGTRLELTKHSGIDLMSLHYSFVTGKLTSRPYRSTHVGFGITYSLPILVAILSAKPGALILLENPEAHLHPKGQAKMGELMARAASCGIQIVVETHSDHILNGIRMAVHAGVILPDDVCLHFFQRREEDNMAYSEIVSPKIDRNGRLDQWPDGFFDEWDKSLETLLMPRED